MLGPFYSSVKPDVRPYYSSIKPGVCLPGDNNCFTFQAWFWQFSTSSVDNIEQFAIQGGNSLSLATSTHAWLDETIIF